MINGNRQARAELDGLRKMSAPVCDLGEDGDEKCSQMMQAVKHGATMTRQSMTRQWSLNGMRWG